MKIAYQPLFRTMQDLPSYLRPQKHVAVAPAKHCNSGKWRWIKVPLWQDLGSPILYTKLYKSTWNEAIFGKPRK